MSAQFQAPVRIVFTAVTAGVPAKLSATPLFVRDFIVQAHHANTGLIFLGDSSANALDANAHALAAGDNLSQGGSAFSARTLQIDLSDYWIDTSVSGSKLIVTYLQEVLHQ